MGAIKLGGSEVFSVDAFNYKGFYVKVQKQNALLSGEKIIQSRPPRPKKRRTYPPNSLPSDHPFPSLVTPSP